MISERRLMVMLRWEDCPQETALTWRLAHRRMTSGARKHDDSVNVDSPHGRDRRKARATQARSAKGMEAEVAPEAASGGAVHARRMARIGGRGAPRVAQDRAYSRSVHPLLRLALSTAILVDRDILITDTGRLPDDYARMGLLTNTRSRHYKQADGWIHAVDLRTTGRGVIKNRGVQFYFWLMGFDARRHVGTADHLHVELN